MLTNTTNEIKMFKVNANCFLLCNIELASQDLRPSYRLWIQYKAKRCVI